MILLTDSKFYTNFSIETLCTTKIVNFRDDIKNQIIMLVRIVIRMVTLVIRMVNLVIRMVTLVIRMVTLVIRMVMVL